MEFGLELSAGAFAVAFVAVCIGAVVQRLAGQAFGMIASPLVAIVAPQHLPATVLMLGLFIGPVILAVAYQLLMFWMTGEDPSIIKPAEETDG